MRTFRSPRPRRVPPSAPSVPAVGLALALAAALSLGACSSTNVQIGAAYDDDLIDTINPDAYAERYGEPDEWTNEKVGSELQSTMVWNCLDGKYRRMVWRLRQQEAGRSFWYLMEDDTEEGRCPEPEGANASP